MTDPRPWLPTCCARDFLKTLANSHRLLILCHLHRGRALGSRAQAALGPGAADTIPAACQRREEALVETRRAGKTIHYRLANNEARQVIELLYELF
jgi:ArsR family transcriptional regulator, virulence genes transcriptional regulator